MAIEVDATHLHSKRSNFPSSTAEVSNSRSTYHHHSYRLQLHATLPCACAHHITFEWALTFYTWKSLLLGFVFFNGTHGSHVTYTLLRQLMCSCIHVSYSFQPIRSHKKYTVWYTLHHTTSSTTLCPHSSVNTVQVATPTRNKQKYRTQMYSSHTGSHLPQQFPG